METLQYFGVLYENVAAVATDSAAYMTLCIKLLRELVNPELIHVQCWAHKLDKVAKVFSDKLTRLNQCVSNTKKLFKNTRKRKHRYVKFLTDKYSFTNAKEAKLFPLPVMTRWGSWAKAVAYLDEYLEDIVEFAKTISDSEKVNSIEYFKGLTPLEVSIIKAEARFQVDYCTPVSDLILKLEGSKNPMSHLLYSSIQNVRKPFTCLSEADDVASLLLEKSKSCFDVIPSATKKRSFKARISSVVKKCDEILENYVSNDSAHTFYKASQKLFDPCKLISGSTTPEKVAVYKEKISLLSSIPTANFQILHSLFLDTVRATARANTNSKLDNNAIVCNSLLSMKAEHPKFVSLCMQVMHIPVSNVDSERAFSSYGDIVSAKRCRLSPVNTEIMMCLYFGDDLDNEWDNNNSSNVPNMNDCENESEDPDEPMALC